MFHSLAAQGENTLRFQGWFESRHPPVSLQFACSPHIEGVATRYSLLQPQPKDLHLGQLV